MQETLVTLAIVFVSALAVSLILAPTVGWLGRKVGFVDKPRPGEMQKLPTPRSGGYAIIIAFWVAVALSLILLPRTDQEQHRLLGVLVGSALVLPIAIIDDACRLGPRPQLIGQIVVAAVAVAFGITIADVASPFGGIVILPLIIVIPLSIVWFVGMINTLNFIDTMDGLAGGVSAIAVLILFLRAFSLQQYTIAALMLGLLGACLGFLPYNLPRAKMFMGTSGSMFLGYMLAILSLVGGAKIATTLMVLAVPILDTAMVIATRTLQGRSPFKGGDAAHFPHRLLAFGLSQRQILMASYALCLALGYLGLSLTAVQKLVTLGAMVAVLVAAIAIVAYRAHHMLGSGRARGSELGKKNK
jgi:UDP-GlcNAc:undecaprenyl-phosphate GlcNAc-1-phosphate transferase